MKVNLVRSLLLASVALAGGTGVGEAAGNYSGLPVIGGTQYCTEYGTSAGSSGSSGPQSGQLASGQVCTQYVPAGPLEGGGEVTPVDTGIANGGSPQSALFPLDSIAAKNLARGGDFSTNLWQRGTTPVSAASPTTINYAADGWFVASASNAMTVSKQTPAATAADFIKGFPSVMRVARPSGTPSGSSCVGQILDKVASAPFIGRNAVLSFVGYAPTTFSAVNETISVSVAYYTAADSATPGTNSATFALSMSGQAAGITGYTADVAGFSGTTPLNGNVASGVASLSLSATPTMYGVYAPIPAVNASGTTVVGIGFSVCATPTLTTTVSTDYFELARVALQSLPSSATTVLAAGNTTPGPFERISPALEARNELAYYFQTNDAVSTQVYGSGFYYTTTECNVVMQFPVPMREVPALAFGGKTLDNTTFAVLNATGVTPVVLATDYLAAGLAAATLYSGSVEATTAGSTAGFGCELIGAATPTTANIQWSAEP